MGVVDNVAKELSLGSSSRRVKRGSKALADKRRSRTTTVNSNASSGGGGRRISPSGKKTVTKAEVLAFNKLSDAARKKASGKIARFRAAGYGIFEDYSVHTSGKGFGKFFSKTSPKYKKGKK